MTVARGQKSSTSSPITEFTLKILPVVIRSAWNARRSYIENALSPVSSQAMRRSKRPIDFLGPTWQWIILEVQRPCGCSNSSREGGDEWSKWQGESQALSEVQNAAWRQTHWSTTAINLVPLFPLVLIYVHSAPRLSMASANHQHSVIPGIGADFMRIDGTLSGPFNFQGVGLSMSGCHELPFGMIWPAFLCEAMSDCLGKSIGVSCTDVSHLSTEWLSFVTSSLGTST